MINIHNYHYGSYTGSSVRPLSVTSHFGSSPFKPTFSKLAAPHKQEVGTAGGGSALTVRDVMTTLGMSPFCGII